MSNQELRKIVATLEALERRKKFRKLDFFKAYPKQALFFEMGATKRERLLMAANQVGKTEAGAAEATYHLTGEYPPNWKGRRWDRPTIGWAAGESSLVVRNVQQKKLCGPPGVDADFGSGYIPKDMFVDKPSLARGVTDAYDMIQVRHKPSGGISTLNFKSYEQGRQKFQGDTLDFVWLDEEPPLDVYSECLTRVTATNGMVYLTFTPLLGRSDVVIRYLDEPSPNRGVVIMTIDDAEHIPVAERAAIIAGYPAHEREARARGVPMLGSGRIFLTAEETILEPGITAIPEHWWKLWAIDFGINHPFAAVLLLWDKDADVVHVHHEIMMADAKPIEHAFAMKQVGANVPVAWPQDGTAREKGSGKALSTLYAEQGLKMLSEHATHPDGSVSTEAAIREMDSRMTTGRFKVASHLTQWMEQYRFYHRKDGMIVKLRDDLISATQKGMMMKRHARQVLLGGKAKRRRFDLIAEGVDFDLS